MSDNQRLYLYDFCGTIYKSNTTLDFLSFLKEKKSILYKVKFWSLWILAKILKDFKIVNEHTYTKIRVYSLKGLHDNEINRYANDFLIDIERRGKLNEQVYSQLKKNNNNGRLILISFTLQNILDQFLKVKNINAEAYGSSLLIDSSGKAVGQYKFFMPKKGKLEFLKAKVSKELLENSFFITDDAVADQDLIRVVKEVKVLK